MVKLESSLRTFNGHYNDLINCYGIAVSQETMIYCIVFCKLSYLHDITEILLKVTFNTITPWIHIDYHHSTFHIFVPSSISYIFLMTISYLFQCKKIPWTLEAQNMLLLSNRNRIALASKVNKEVTLYWTESYWYRYQLVAQWINR